MNERAAQPIGTSNSPHYFRRRDVADLDLGVACAWIVFLLRPDRTCAGDHQGQDAEKQESVFAQSIGSSYFVARAKVSFTPQRKLILTVINLRAGREALSSDHRLLYHTRAAQTAQEGTA